MRQLCLTLSREKSQPPEERGIGSGVQQTTGAAPCCKGQGSRSLENEAINTCSNMRESSLSDLRVDDVANFSRESPRPPPMLLLPLNYRYNLAALLAALLVCDRWSMA